MNVLCLGPDICSFILSPILEIYKKLKKKHNQTQPDPASLIKKGNRAQHKINLTALKVSLGDNLRFLHRLSGRTGRQWFKFFGRKSCLSDEVEFWRWRAPRWIGEVEFWRWECRFSSAVHSELRSWVEEGILLWTLHFDHIITLHFLF